MNGGGINGKRKFVKKYNRRTINNVSESPNAIPNDSSKDFESCERGTLGLQKLKLLLEMDVLKQTMPILYSSQENMRLRIAHLEYLEDKLKDEVRLLRFDLKEVIPALEVKKEIPDEISFSLSEPSNNAAIRAFDKPHFSLDNNADVTHVEINHAVKTVKTGESVLVNHFKGIKVKLVNFVLSKHGEDIVINSIKRITNKVAKGTSSENTEVLRVYLMKSKKFTIQSIHSPLLSKLLFISKRYYAITWKRKSPDDVMSNTQPVLVDDDEEYKKATLEVLRPLETNEVICSSKMFHIGTIHNILINEKFHVICEEPFQIRPLGGEVVLSDTQINVLRPHVLKTLQKAKLSGPVGNSIPTISIMTESRLKNKILSKPFTIDLTNKYLEKLPRIPDAPQNCTLNQKLVPLQVVDIPSIKESSSALTARIANASHKRHSVTGDPCTSNQSLSYIAKYVKLNTPLESPNSSNIIPDIFEISDGE